MVLLSSSGFGDLRARLVDRVACSGKARPLAESYSRFSRLDLIKTTVIAFPPFVQNRLSARTTHRQGS